MNSMDSYNLLKYTRLLLFSTLPSVAQVNLIPNSSFETYTACPFIYDYIEYSGSWYEPSCGTSDLFNDCDSNQTNADVPKNFLGYQFAHNGGKGYGGLMAYKVTSWVPSHREYMQCHLNEPLKAGVTYFVSFFVSLADNSTHGINSLGMYFSGTPVKATVPYPDCASILPFVPQVGCSADRFLVNTTGWEEIAGAYKAQGGEQYITIGNFRDNTGTDTVRVPTGSTWPSQSYYYIDDVCVSSHHMVCGVDRALSLPELSSSSLWKHDKAKKAIILDEGYRNSRYQIISIQGNMIRQGDLMERTEIDLSELQAGMYCVALSTDTDFYYRKILID